MITVFSIISSSGTGRYTAHLVGELAKYHQVTLIAPPFEDYRDLLGDVPLRPLPKVDGIKSKALRWAVMAYSTLSPIRDFIALRRVSDRIYFANAGHWPQIGIYLLGAKLCGFKTALLIHDVFPHRALFPKRWQNFERRCLGAIYRLADRLIVHHPGAIDDLAAIGVPRERGTVIPHGLFDLPAARNRNETPANDGLRLLLFGQIRRNKNILAVIKAVQELRAQGHDVTLRICGKASARENDYLDLCRQAVAARPDGISLEEGFVSEDELPALVAWCDAFLLPYRDFHSQSGVAMLALANGKPLIASMAGGLAELMREESGGIRIDAAGEMDAASIAEAIVKAERLGRDALVSRGQQARQWIEATTAWPVVGRQHARMIESLGRQATA